MVDGALPGLGLLSLADGQPGHRHDRRDRDARLQGEIGCGVGARRSPTAIAGPERRLPIDKRARRAIMPHARTRRPARDPRDPRMTAPDGAHPPRKGLTREQRLSLPPFAAIRAFEAIGTCGGIRRAALELSIDHAAVSRHLRALETWAGVALVDRAGGGASLTESGLKFHRAITQGLAGIAAASLELTRRADDAHLSLWCSPGLASEWLTGRLGSFSAILPDVAIEIQPSELTPDAAQDVDAHLHYVIDAIPWTGDGALRSVEIARPPILAVASPAYLETARPFDTPADLLDAALLHEANFDQWRRWFEAHGVETTNRLSGSKLWQGHLTLAAARRGQGIALANALLVGDSLRSGELVAIGDWKPIHLGGYMFTARRNHWRDRTVMGFRRWLENSIAAESWSR
jgi:LysR family glycine cleavage system transcriptional activator